MQETQVRFLGWEDSLEKEMVTASSYSCLENPMDWGAWKAIVHGVTRVRHDLATKPPTTTVISVAPLDSQGLFKTARTEISSSVALAALFHSCYFSFFLLHCSICLRVCSLTSRVLGFLLQFTFQWNPGLPPLFPPGAPPIPAALSRWAWLPSPSPCSHICSLSLHFYSCPGNRSICTIFLVYIYTLNYPFKNKLDFAYIIYQLLYFWYFLTSTLVY